MKTITAEQRQRLEDLSAEGLLKLPLAIAEKDVHITDLLMALSQLVVAHDGFKDLDKRREPTRADTGIVLVFAGGTCLSKAHGLIERMSEDIDIKGQNPEFDADPVNILRETLEHARTHSELQARYEDTLLPLVYGSSAPSYAQAFSAFEDVATDFLSSCESAETVQVT